MYIVAFLRVLPPSLDLWSHNNFTFKQKKKKGCSTEKNICLVEVPTSTRDEALVPCTNSRGIPRGPSQLERIPDFPEITWEAPSDPLGNSREPTLPAATHNSRNTLRFPLPCKLRPDFPAVTPEHSCAHPRNLNGDLTSLRQHERLPEFPMVPGEESQASSHNSRQTTRCPVNARWGPFLLQHLESNPTFPLKTWEKAWLTLGNSRGPRDPRHNSRWKPNFPPQLD